MNQLNPFTVGIVAMIPQDAWDKGVTFVCLTGLAAWTYFREKTKDKKDECHINQIMELNDEKVNLLKAENLRVIAHNQKLTEEVINCKTKK